MITYAEQLALSPGSIVTCRFCKKPVMLEDSYWRGMGNDMCDSSCEGCAIANAPSSRELKKIRKDLEAAFREFKNAVKHAEL